MRGWLSRARPNQTCACTVRRDANDTGATLIVDAEGCPGDGRLSESADCRRTVVEALGDREADSVLTRSAGRERAYLDDDAALLCAAGRFVERVRIHDERLAERALTDPIGAATEATGRAGPVATIAASRGCPFHCKFCDTSTFGDRVRHYSPEVVFKLMKYLHETHCVRHIGFVDDLFLASKNRVRELCERIMDDGLKMTWSCTARVDTVKPEVLKLMKQAGCWEISFGLETGSNDLLKKMDKLAEVEKSARAIRWTDEAGIRSKGLFMLGFPGEDEHTIQQTKDFIRDIPMTIMNLTKFTPYPGSPIYRELYGTNIRDDHWEKMNGMNFVWAPEGLSVAELDRHYQEILLSFYHRPQIGWYFTKLTFAYPNHFYRLIRFGLGFLKAKLVSFLSGRKGLLIKQREPHLDAVD
jgi:radical SAM superfamily enzyme YgiQ (UPF0313 family)